MLIWPKQFQQRVLRFKNQFQSNFIKTFLKPFLYEIQCKFFEAVLISFSNLVPRNQSCFGEKLSFLPSTQNIALLDISGVVSVDLAAFWLTI